MTTTTGNCPKCGGEMERGYMLEMDGSATIEHWARGEPKQSWFGTWIKRPKITDLLPIGSFRCLSCGYLELYASKDLRPK